MIISSIRSESDEETRKAGEELAKKLHVGTLICFYGELGAGKTTFIRGLAKGLGIKSKIQSPTFTYQRIHTGRLTLYHFDCYRLDSPDQLIVNEINEAIASENGIVAIEWAEKIEEMLPKKRIDVRIKYGSTKKRTITFHNYD